MTCLQKLHRYQHWATAHIKTARVSHKLSTGPIIKCEDYNMIPSETYTTDSLIPCMVMIIEHYKIKGIEY